MSLQRAVSECTFGDTQCTATMAKSDVGLAERVTRSSRQAETVRHNPEKGDGGPGKPTDARRGVRRRACWELVVETDERDKRDHRLRPWAWREIGSKWCLKLSLGVPIEERTTSLVSQLRGFGDRFERLTYP